MTMQRPIPTAVAEMPLHLVEEINHRVINEYAEAISSLSLAAAEGPSGDAPAALVLAAERLRAHADTHRALLRPADGQVNLADYIGGLCASLSRASLADRRVHLTLDSDDIWISSARAWRIGLAISELVRNAARHGLHGRGGSIAVRLAEHDGHILGRVGDNGLAREALQPGRGVGLVRALAAELGGSADWLLSPSGCMAHFHVPISATEP